MIVDAVRNSRVEYVAMMGTTKMTQAGSPGVASVGLLVGVSTLSILIIGVLLLITGGGPPI